MQKYCQTVKQITKQYNTSFHVIPHIHSPLTGLFLHISMATMTTFRSHAKHKHSRFSISAKQDLPLLNS